MLNAVIRFALNHRLLIVVVAIAVIVYGAIETQSLPIDVLPDLTRPRVVLITECPGYAPEEVETLVTIPLEIAINGANGVIAVRTASDIGLSVIYVEFDWNADVYTARQIVQERISIATERLPTGIHPQMAPTSSLLGQIMIVGMWSEDGSTGPRSGVNQEHRRNRRDCRQADRQPHNIAWPTCPGDRGSRNQTGRFERQRKGCGCSQHSETTRSRHPGIDGGNPQSARRVARQFAKRHCSQADLRAAGVHRLLGR